jgi:glycosyltransferase involved in cell wall biosynthesis
MPTLSLVIPCFNEAKNLPQLLEHCVPLGAFGDIEVIIVDNGSTDNTSEILKELLPKYPFCRSCYVPQNKGYGYGILQGLAVSNGDVLSWTHADMQTDPADVLRGLKLFKEYGEQYFIKGSRINRPIFDSIFTVGMSVFESAIFQKPFWDINAQPNIFSREFYQSWNNPPHDYSLDLYIYSAALNKKMHFHRFPVEFKQRLHGESHWNTSWTKKIQFIIKTISFSLALKRRGGD